MQVLRVVMGPALLLTMVGCATDIGEGAGDGTAVTDHESSEFALVNSADEVGVLRRGQTLNFEMDVGRLAPNQIYVAQVMNGEDTISQTEVLTDMYGGVITSTLMHDVGEYDDITDGARLAVTLTDPFEEIVARSDVILSSTPMLWTIGFNVEEAIPPHVFAADASGEPQNAFAVGGSGGDEVRGPVYAAGSGFPNRFADGMVDVYAVVDGDDWRGRAFPTAGDPAHIAGPIEAYVDAEGRLTPVAVFEPGIDHVGVYDILVDVDRDGTFGWDYNIKDGADGLAKVGFTIQYSESWLRERTSQHVLVNLAYDSHRRGDGTWRNEFTNGEPVFLYVNPPVMHDYHFRAVKVILEHQDFDTFWNNPAMVDPACGGVPYQTYESRSLAVVTESGCTNTSPTCFGAMEVPDDGTTETATFDVVMDRDGDGCYDLGEDLLDVTSGGQDGSLVSVEDFLAMPASQRVGFSVLLH